MQTSAPGSAGNPWQVLIGDTVNSPTPTEILQRSHLLSDTHGNSLLWCSTTCQYVLQTTAKTLNLGDLWADSGCVRGVGGEDEHDKYRHYMSKLGLKPMVAQCNEQFQFGDGNVEIANKKYFYPVFIRGEYRGILDQASVPVNCPQLLSKMVMQNWMWIYALDLKRLESISLRLSCLSVQARFQL